jgi:hypothetical protein
MTEPKATLYTPKWNEAQQRVQQVDPATRAVFVTLLDHIERGWEVLRPLQVWFEQHAPDAAADDDHARLLTFCEGSVTDVFLQVSRGVADLVPGTPGWREEADPSDVDGWAEAFGQGLNVLRLACAGATVPKHFRGMVASAAEHMDGGWCRLLAALLSAVGELIPAAAE